MSTSFFSRVLGLCVLALLAACEISSAQIRADGVNVPLNTKLSEIRKALSLTEDVENLDTAYTVYWYDNKAIETNGFTVTPQTIFFVKKPGEHITKATVTFLVECNSKDCSLSTSDLSAILKLVKEKDIPALALPYAPEFESTVSYSINKSMLTLHIGKSGRETELYVSVE
jgi:uncharacterized protein YcfL